MIKKFFTLLLFAGAAISLTAGSFWFPAIKTQTKIFVPEKISGGVEQYSLRAYDSGAVATAEVDLPEAGTYDLYIRNLSYGDQSRTIEVEIDGKVFAAVGDELKTTGKPSPLIWSKFSEPATLSAGKHIFKFTTRGANARFDAFLLTTESEANTKNAQQLNPQGNHIRQGKPRLKITTEKNPVLYKRGEKMNFIATAKLGFKALENAGLRYVRIGDDGKKENGVVPFEDGKAIYTTSLDSPGFVRVKFYLTDESGNNMVFVNKKGELSILEPWDGGAGADIENIPQLPEPEDFDAFWQKQKEKLASVPVQIIEKRLVSTAWENEYDTYAVTVACPGPSPVTGFMNVPKNATPKSLKALVLFAGYGTGEQKPIRPYAPDSITLRINAHGMPLGREPEFYREFAKKMRGYALNDGADRETCYFNGMALRVMRALEFVKSLPEWNGTNLKVSGGSQGGMQSLWAAGLDSDVTFCEAFVPWGCNMGEITIGLQGREAAIIEYAPSRCYYDGANFAKRIKCPVSISRAGVGDYICPPSGVSRAYFNIKSPKEIVWYQNNGHFNPNEPKETFRFHSDDFTKK